MDCLTFCCLLVSGRCDAMGIVRCLDAISRYLKIALEYVQLEATYKEGRGTRWRSRLRHCATSRKVASLNPDDVIGIFHWHNPSGRTMTLGSTQPLTEMSTRNISWG